VERRPGWIVILNGAPRSGKSSIAAAIQETFDGVWMNLGVDVFVTHVTPRRYQPGMGLRPGEEGHPVAPLVPALYEAFYGSVAAHSRAGLNVVVDVGHHDRGVLAASARQRAGLPVLFVGVRCPIDVVVARRTATWGSDGGAHTADWQRLVHDHEGYDVEVDTSLLTPEQCAEAIRRRLAEGPPPDAVARLAR